jgi:MFS family permease
MHPKVDEAFRNGHPGRMTSGRPEDDHIRAREGAEEALLDTPLPHGGALPPGLLGNRPFVWLAASFGVSQLGFWAFFLAIIGQASYRNHAGVFQLAVLFSSFSVTFILLTVPFGMIVDRWSPKWLMIVSGLISLASILIAVIGTSLPWLDAAFAIDGVAAALIIPARGSLTALMVKERDLVRANGMLNTASMFAVIIGPGTAGLVERHSGHAVIYWYIFAAIVAGILLNLFVPDRRPRGKDESRFAADLTEGFRVSWHVPELRDLVFLSCGIWFLTTVLITLEPLYVRGVLHRGVDGLGFLWSAHGVGSFLGAAALTRSRNAHGHEVFLLGVSLIVAGAGFLAYVGSSFFVVAVGGTVVLGVGFAWYLSLSQALIQRVTAENLRGRVTGVVGMIQEFAAMSCSLLIAGLGGLITSVQPYLIGAGALLFVSGFYGLRAGRRIERLRAGAVLAPLRE